MQSESATGSSRFVGIIGGTGWLGRNIGRRALERGLVRPASLLISSRSAPGDAYAEWPEVRWTSDNRELVEASDVVVLSVRPQEFRGMPFEAAGRLVISVMAGVSAQELMRRSGSERIVRTMPNAAVEIGASFTPWWASDAADGDDRAFVQALFSCCGTAMPVETESDLDYLTALSGSGPAFPALLAEAMIAHALEHGLSPEIARRAVEGVVCDASRLLANPATTPAEMVRTFVDYRGTTAAGLLAMREHGFAGAVRAGLSAAAEKARAMAAAADATGSG